MDNMSPGTAATSLEALKTWIVKREKPVRYILFAGLASVFLITRLWQLTTLPYGLHLDEAGMGYSAFCLAEYGVDRYLKSWPIYPNNFWGGQSAMYLYLCTFLFRLFGYHPFLIRIPAVLLSFLNLIFGMKLAHIAFPKNKFIPWLVGILLTVCPYFIMASRFALDCNLMLGMSTVFLYFFTTAIQSGSPRRCLLAGITGGLVLYTYILSYIVLPLFLILALIYVICIKRFSLKNWAVMALPMGLLAFPLILVQIINYFDLREFKIGCFTINKLEIYRISEVGGFSFARFQQALSNVFTGDNYLPYNSAPGYDNLYSVTVYLFVLGLIVCLARLGLALKKRTFEVLPLALFWFLSILLFESRIDSNVNKLNGIFYVVVLIAAAGLDILQQAFGKFGPVPLIAAGCIYFFCFLDFSSYYYGGAYTAETDRLPFFDITITDGLRQIADDPVLSGKETQMAQPEIIFALSSLPSPYDLQIGKRDDHFYQNYHMGSLSSIDDRCNYIVSDGLFDDYCAELRAAGFQEIHYEGYTLFYKRC